MKTLEQLSAETGLDFAREQSYMLMYDKYQELALRTLNDKGKDMNLIHAMLGMATEAVELQTDIFIKGTSPLGELGDCAWYLAVGARQLEIDFSDLLYEVFEVLDAEDSISDKDPRLSLYQLVGVGSELASVAKANLFYDKPLDYELLGVLCRRYALYLWKVSQSSAGGLPEPCVRNIAKLQARYPGKFDRDAAINRDYAAESSAAGTVIS